MENKLPEGWEWKKLGEVSTIGAGNGAPQGDQYFENGEYPFVRTSDVGKDGQNICLKSPRDKVNNFAITECKLKLWPQKTLLIPKSGASTFLNHRALLGEPAYVSSHLATIIPKDSVLPEYLYYWSLILDAKSLTPNTNYPSLKLSDIETAKIPVPPLETQQKIVSILEKAEETKKLRAQADELTQKLLQSVFLEMFGDPVKNSKNWEKKKLKELGEIITGNTPSREKPEYYGDYIEWIKSDNINTPYIYLTKSEEMLSEKGAKVGRIAPINSVLVTCIAGSLSCIGNVAIADRNIAFNQQINAIVPNENVNTSFLYHLILNTKEYIQSYSTQSMKGMVSKGILGSIFFIIPPIEVQMQYAKFTKRVEKMITSQNQSSLEINNLFDALMQKAFTGELVS